MSDASPIEVGSRASVTRRVTQDDVEAFAKLGLDYNPVHFDEQFAQGTFFGRPVAHGMLGAALLSGALTELMGPGNIWLSADIKFDQPIFAGDELRAELEVQSLDRRGVATIAAQVRNDRDQTVISGILRSMNFAARRPKAPAPEGAPDA